MFRPLACDGFVASSGEEYEVIKQSKLVRYHFLVLQHVLMNFYIFDLCGIFHRYTNITHMYVQSDISISPVAQKQASSRPEVKLEPPDLDTQI